MPHSSTVSFLSYWRGLQDSPDKAPARALFDPARLKSLIPQMMMIADGDHNHRFRLSGGFLVAFHGYELKDTPFLSLFQDAYADTVQTALIMSRRRQQPIVLTISAPWRSRDPATGFDETGLSRNETVTFEVCLCPMVNRDGIVDRFVGIYQTLSTPPRNPIGSIGQYTLVASRLQDPKHTAPAAHLKLVAHEGKRIA